MRTLLRALGDWFTAFLLTLLLPATLMLPGFWAPVAMIAVLALFVWIFLLRRRGRTRRLATLRVRPLGSTTKWLLIAVLPVVAFLLSLNVLLISLIDSSDINQKTHSAFNGFDMKFVLAFFFATVAGPFVEEVLFRGRMQSRMQRRWGPHVAIALTALGFAVLHTPISYALQFFAAGMVFGYAVFFTRSLWAGVVLHTCTNAFVHAGRLLAESSSGGATANDERIGLLLPLGALVLSTPLTLLTLNAVRRARQSVARCGRNESPASRLHPAAR